ncbi:hypothetical protein [Cellulomonas sp. C5510]|uniref:hypothetical protein n=1 Tax=Cellulomonas sp. C5510 TaxID=2871170 RepID=UPI001C95AC4D|nr:hypothetical protein [Cellulomonas sp. C5510]QZN86611.1 hypothetical protein K5O09_05540 [Cellulomonas sp. C5510]
MTTHEARLAEPVTTWLRYGDRVEVVGWDAPQRPYWDGPALVLAVHEDGTAAVVASGTQPAASACACLGPCAGVFDARYLRRV